MLRRSSLTLRHGKLRLGGGARQRRAYRYGGYGFMRLGLLLLGIGCGVSGSGRSSGAAQETAGSGAAVGGAQESATRPAPVRDCFDRENCQGRIDGMDDDSACNHWLARDCTPNASIICSSAIDQDPQECPTTCGTDTDCAVNFICVKSLCVARFPSPTSAP